MRRVDYYWMIAMVTVFTLSMVSWANAKEANQDPMRMHIKPIGMTDLPLEYRMESEDQMIWAQAHGYECYRDAAAYYCVLPQKQGRR